MNYKCFVSNSCTLFSDNTKLSSYCVHYFTVSSYSYYVTLKSSSWRLHFRMNFLAGPEPNVEIYASYHRRRERQPSLHICKLTMSFTESKNTLSHIYIKSVPVTLLGAVSQHVTTSGASEPGNISRNLTCLKCQTEGSVYYHYGVPNVTPYSLADW
jgi:hypothetical protein